MYFHYILQFCVMANTLLGKSSVSLVLFYSDYVVSSKYLIFTADGSMDILTIGKEPGFFILFCEPSFLA